MTGQYAVKEVTGEHKMKTLEMSCQDTWSEGIRQEETVREVVNNVANFYIFYMISHCEFIYI